MAPLHRFSYLIPFQLIRDPESRYPGQRDDEQRCVETYNLFLILNLCRESLESLKIPMALADELLKNPFPSLTQLILHGDSPPMDMNPHELWSRAVVSGASLLSLDLRAITLPGDNITCPFEFPACKIFSSTLINTFEFLSE